MNSRATLTAPIPRHLVLFAEACFFWGEGRILLSNNQVSDSEGLALFFWLECLALVVQARLLYRS